MVKSCKDFVEGFLLCSTIVATLHRIVGSHPSAEEYSCYREQLSKQYSWYWCIKNILAIENNIQNNILGIAVSRRNTLSLNLQWLAMFVIWSLPLFFSDENEIDRPRNSSWINFMTSCKSFSLLALKRGTCQRTYAVTELFLFTILIPVFTFAKSCYKQTQRSCTEGSVGRL